jgi:hypothetical protein
MAAAMLSGTRTKHEATGKARNRSEPHPSTRWQGKGKSSVLG